MDDSKLYKKVNANAVWHFNVAPKVPDHEIVGSRTCIVPPDAYEKLVAIGERYGHFASLALLESGVPLSLAMDFGMSGGMVPTFSHNAAAGEFNVIRRMSDRGERGRFKCRFWEVQTGVDFRGTLLRWEGTTAVGCFCVHHKRKVSPPPICTLGHLRDLIFREDVAEKFTARGWPGVSFVPFEFAPIPEEWGGGGLIFSERYFRLCVSGVMPRRHGLLDYVSETDSGSRLPETIPCWNLNGIAPHPQVFATDTEPEGDLVRSRECDYGIGPHQSHRLFASEEFKAWAKAEEIPLHFGNAFFLDSFENLTATEYLSRLKTGGPLW